MDRETLHGGQFVRRSKVGVSTGRFVPHQLLDGS